MNKLRSPAASGRASRLRRHRFAALMVATALAPAMIPLLPQNDFRPGIAVAFARGNVTIEKVEIPTGFGTIVLNQVAVTGSSLPRAEIEALFQSRTLVGLPDRLEKLDADNLTIRSLVFTMKIEGNNSVTTYENIEAKSIKRGAVGLFTVASARQEAQNKVGDKEMKFQSTYGRMSIEAMDLAAGFRWFTDADPSGKAPMKRIYGRSTMEGFKISGGDQFNMEFGRIEADYFDMRLPRRSMVQAFPELMAASAQKDDPNVSARVFALLVDLYGSYSFGKVSMAGAKGTFKTPEGPGEFKMGPGTFEGGGKPQGKMTGFELKATDGFVRIREIGGYGDLYAAMLTGMAKGLALSSDKEAARKGNPDAKMLTPESRALLEETALEAGRTLQGKDVGFSISGVEADVPPGKSAKSKDRVKFTMEGFESTAGGFIGITPTRIGLSLKNFLMPLPANSQDKSIVALKEFGLDRLGLTTNLKASWAEAGSTLSIPEVSVDVEKLARVSLKGEFGGVPRAFFEVPTKNWPMLLGSANIKRLDVAVANRGGLDKVLAKAAGDQGKTPEQFRMELSGMAPAMIAGMLSGHPDAVKLSQAVGNFLQSLKGLDVAAIAVSPAGITVPEIMAASNNPMMLLPKVKFEANGM